MLFAQRQSHELSVELFELRLSSVTLKPVAVENKVMRHQKNALVFHEGITKRPLEKFRRELIEVRWRMAEIASEITNLRNEPGIFGGISTEPCSSTQRAAP